MTKIESTKYKMLRWTENSTIKYAHKWRRGEWKEFTHRETYSLSFIGLNIIITHHLPITNNAEVTTTVDKCKGFTARLGESQQPANRGSWTSHLTTLISEYIPKHSWFDLIVLFSKRRECYHEYSLYVRINYTYLVCELKKNQLEKQNVLYFYSSRLVDFQISLQYFIRNWKTTSKMTFQYFEVLMVET